MFRCGSKKPRNANKKEVTYKLEPESSRLNPESPKFEHSPAELEKIKDSNSVQTKSTEDEKWIPGSDSHPNEHPQIDQVRIRDDLNLFTFQGHNDLNSYYFTFHDMSLNQKDESFDCLVSSFGGRSSIGLLNKANSLGNNPISIFDMQGNIVEELNEPRKPQEMDLSALRSNSTLPNTNTQPDNFIFHSIEDETDKDSIAWISPFKKNTSIKKSNTPMMPPKEGDSDVE